MQFSSQKLLQPLRKIKWVLTRHFLKTRQYQPENNYYIFSEPRGGSTWLMGVIQQITQAPVIWEPMFMLSPRHPFRQIGFYWNQYIPENADWPEAKLLFEQLFRGEILYEGIFRFATPWQVAQSRSLLFKFCHANSLLPWLCQNFRFQHKPIYLLRHPFAVVYSQLNHGAWERTPSRFFIPTNVRHREIFLQHEDFLHSLSTREEVLTANWCLSNVVVLNSPAHNQNWITLHYEHLVLEPQQQIQRILQAWNMTFNISQIDFRKNSPTTQSYSPKQPTRRIAQWQQLPADTLKRMARVLTYFNIKEYEPDKPMPTETFL